MLFLLFLTITLRNWQMVLLIPFYKKRKVRLQVPWEDEIAESHIDPADRGSGSPKGFSWCCALVFFLREKGTVGEIGSDE